MNSVISVETAVCTQHQKLSEACQRALDVWNEQRAEFSKSYPISAEAGDELVRLQANYARSYTMLQRHEHSCLLCQLVSRGRERDYENSSDSYFESVL
jgi:hypothetical protein